MMICSSNINWRINVANRINFFSLGNWNHYNFSLWLTNLMAARLFFIKTDSRCRWAWIDCWNFRWVIRLKLQAWFSFLRLVYSTATVISLFYQTFIGMFLFWLLIFAFSIIFDWGKWVKSFGFDLINCIEEFRLVSAFRIYAHWCDIDHTLYYFRLPFRFSVLSLNLIFLLNIISGKIIIIPRSSFSLNCVTYHFFANLKHSKFFTQTLNRFNNINKNFHLFNFANFYFWVILIQFVNFFCVNDNLSPNFSIYT